MDLLLERDERDVSLVDVISFLVMQRQGLDEAFGFDREGYPGSCRLRF